ncbi:MAG: M1 family metallopeptidase [Saprospiraceae bacterium]|nr:M1 family metallopeptidase [Saprospiraceae bacterium]
MPAYQFLLALALFLQSQGMLSAQELYMPRNIAAAYAKQTRSMDGKPGVKYWQNQAKYRIEVSLDLPGRQINGQVDIQYINNSPDTLKMIRLKLAHDLWRKNGQRAYDLAAEDITDGVEIRNVIIDTLPLDKKQIQQSNTFLDLKLDQALAPGKSLQIWVDWSHTQPADKRAPRECAYDSTTWFVAYWYPEVAVYDDVHGWADAPYTGLQEMYHDFSDYEVNISVPGNVMVWATGTWNNAKEILQPEYLKRYEAAQNSAEVVRIFSPEDYAKKATFFKGRTMHTFQYQAKGVPDFAFACSGHYLWDATTTVVDPSNGRKALVAAAYDADSKDFYEVCRVGADGLALMSTWLPGYPYPYPAMTVFNGSGGMEFPMMCNDGSTHPRSPIGLTVHETAHTYFPFMMGINEQYYAWMDEGWAAFFDVLVTDSLAGKSQGRLRNYPDFAGTDADMPPMTPSRHLSNPAYRVASYNRAQAAYMNLYQLLGQDRFHQCMVEYMNRWKGKHPQPFDFFHTWNATAGQNLDWFWKPWFFNWGFPDLAVAGVDKRGVVIANRGTMPSTVVGVIEYSDGSKENFRRTAEVWKSGNKEILIPVTKGKTVRQVSLGDPQVSDTISENNSWISK